MAFRIASLLILLYSGFTYNTPCSEPVPESVMNDITKIKKVSPIGRVRSDLPIDTEIKIISGKIVYLPPPLACDRNYQAPRLHAVVNALYQSNNSPSKNPEEKHYYGKHKRNGEKAFASNDDFSWAITGSVHQVIEYSGGFIDLLKERIIFTGSNWEAVKEAEGKIIEWRLHTKPFGVLTDQSFCYGQYRKSQLLYTHIDYEVTAIILINGILIEIYFHCGRIDNEIFSKEMNDDIISWRDAILAANE